MSAPDFEDIEYDPEDPRKASASDDAGSCVDFFCRMPLTTIVIIGLLIVGPGYLWLTGNLMLQILGTAIPFLVIGFLYYRYKR